MKPWTILEFTQRLEAEGFALPPHEAWVEAAHQESEMPWFVRALIGAGAWFAGLFLAVGLGAILALGNQTEAMLALGLMLCGGACLLRAFTKADFSVQMALALSIAGQGFVGFGMEKHMGAHAEASLWATMVVLELALILAFRDALHRFLSTAAAAVFFALIFMRSGSGNWAIPLVGLALGVGWCLPNRFWQNPAEAFRRPVLYGLSVAFLGLLAWRLAFDLIENHIGFSSHDRTQLNLLAPVVYGILLAFGTWRVLHRLELIQPGNLAVAIPVVVALGVVGYWAPGIPAGLFVMVVAIETREPLLFAFAAVAGMAFLGHFYYALQTSLMAKAGVLLLTGSLLLGLRGWFGWRTRSC